LNLRRRDDRLPLFARHAPPPLVHVVIVAVITVAVIGIDAKKLRVIAG
jgi:hypothetical protein